MKKCPFCINYLRGGFCIDNNCWFMFQYCNDYIYILAKSFNFSILYSLGTRSAECARGNIRKKINIDIDEFNDNYFMFYIICYKLYQNSFLE